MPFSYQKNQHDFMALQIQGPCHNENRPQKRQKSDIAGFGDTQAVHRRREQEPAHKYICKSALL
jgi:hypothetical protein